MEPQEIVERLREIAAPGSPPTDEDLRFLRDLATAIEGESGGSGGPAIRRLAVEVRP